MRKSSIVFYGICLLAGIANFFLPDSAVFQIPYVIIVISIAIIASIKVKRIYGEQ